MRTKFTVLNSFAGIVQLLIPSILKFISRTIFIRVLGVTYLGVNSLFSDLFAMLSLMELGVGGAMTFFLYEPLAKNNFKKIKQLMQLYAKLYNFIGLFIGIIGFLILPFLGLIINTEVQIHNLELIYVLMLVNLVSSYFFTYKRSLFTADQKNYQNSINKMLFDILRHIMQIVVLLLTNNYILYLIVEIIVTLSSNIAISKKADETYAYLKEPAEEKLQKSEIRHIFTRVSALFGHKIGSVVVFGTDNIMMSIFGNVQFVGLYANYSIITNALSSLIAPIFRNMDASIGNLNNSESHEKVYEVFKKANFLNFFLISFSSICLYFLLNPFIVVWLGKNYLISQNVVFIIVLNFYLNGIRLVSLSFSNGKGYFWETRFKPVVEAMLDLIFSLILGFSFGPIGILFATTISYASTIWVEPYVLYKKWFMVNARVYFKDFIIKVTLSLFIGFVISLIVPFVTTFTDSIIVLFLVVIISTLFFLIIFFYRTKEFKYFLTLSINIIKRKM